MPEYTATFFFADGSMGEMVVFALDDEEAIRRAQASSRRAASVEIRSGPRLVAMAAKDARAEPEQRSGAAPAAVRTVEEPRTNEARRERGNQHMLTILLGAFLCATVLALLGWVLRPAERDTALSGMVTVVNGGALILDGQPIWLAGIEAPNLNTEAGRQARRLMIDLTGGQEVVCVETERDEDARLFATCSANGRDLAQALIDAGAVRRAE